MVVLLIYFPNSNNSSFKMISSSIISIISFKLSVSKSLVSSFIPKIKPSNIWLEKGTNTLKPTLTLSCKSSLTK